jgi:hypothetical protein
VFVDDVCAHRDDINPFLVLQGRKPAAPFSGRAGAA